MIQQFHTGQELHANRKNTCNYEVGGRLAKIPKEWNEREFSKSD
jgi:hypothetical protein